jgi:hypothetical protein
LAKHHPSELLLARMPHSCGKRMERLEEVCTGEIVRWSRSQAKPLEELLLVTK